MLLRFDTRTRWRWMDFRMTPTHVCLVWVWGIFLDHTSKNQDAATSLVALVVAFGSAASEE